MTIRRKKNVWTYCLKNMKIWWPLNFQVLYGENLNYYNAASFAWQNEQSSHFMCHRTREMPYWLGWFFSYGNTLKGALDQDLGRKIITLVYLDGFQGLTFMELLWDVSAEVESSLCLRVAERATLSKCF